MDLPTTHYDKPEAAKETVAPTPASSGQNSESLLFKISYYLVLLSVLLTPLIFIPSLYAPLDVVKTVFIETCILIAALLYAIDAMKKRTLVVPHYPLGYAALLILCSLVLSALGSSAIIKSFMGQGFEQGTVSFILLMFVVAYLVSRIIIRDREMIFKIYAALFIAFIVLALFHIARFFGGANFLALGFLPSLTATVIGKWYDFATLTASIGLLSFLGIKFLPLRTGLKRVLCVTLVVCGILLLVINSSFIWGIVALVILMVGIYEYSIHAPKGTGLKAIISRVSIFTFIVLILALACAWKGNQLAAPLVKAWRIEYGEPILPWQLTLDIASETIKESPLLGSGPNRFGYQYLRFKPAEVNQSQFWNLEFTSGFGLIPTFATTQGILGILSWTLFFIFFVREGIRSLRKVSDPLKRFFFSSSFFTAALLWLIDIVYIPSQPIVFMTFVFTGIFVALVISEGFATEKHLGQANGARWVKLTPILYSIGIVVLVIWIGVYAKKTIAITYFQKGIKELNLKKSLDTAEVKFKKALSWDTSDIYYQALSEVNILKINTLTQQLQAEATQGIAPDQKKVDKVLALIGDSVKYTKSAQKIDPKNYYNYLAEARISELGASLKIANAYENAKNSYTNAIAVNPYNPALYLNLARLEASQNHLAEAQQLIGRSLQIKSNYIEAIYLLSQVQVANNQIKEAIVSTQLAIGLTPNEPLLYFQLGLLTYNDKNYAGAIAALEKAVSLNAEYANARYFLGLSYTRMGRIAEGITQFEELAKTNPENKEVIFILENLKEGKSPFADVEPPIDAKPEKRKVLPVTEKTTSTKAVKKTN